MFGKPFPLGRSPAGGPIPSSETLSVGGPTDIAYANAEDDFKRIGNIPVFKGNLNVGHGGTFFRDAGAGWFGEVGVAWLKWQLQGDQAAAKYFVGADCTLCTNPAWKVEKKNLK